MIFITILYIILIIILMFIILFIYKDICEHFKIYSLFDLINDFIERFKGSE